MAPLTAVHWNVAGDTMPVALFAGAISVAAAVLHAAPLATVMVKDLETPEGQSPKRASTTHLIVPFGTAAVSCVVFVVAPMRKRSELAAESLSEPKTR